MVLFILYVAEQFYLFDNNCSTVQDKMEKTNELPGSESPNSQEERQNRKQPHLSPLSPIESEGAQISIPSFRKGQNAINANFLGSLLKRGRHAPVMFNASILDSKVAMLTYSALPPYSACGPYLLDRNLMYM